MQEHADDQSHYEISLTAGQAFVAFVLLLLSLAAAFTFGLLIGKGQADERLVVRKETPVVTEAGPAAKKTGGRIVELGVEDEAFQQTESAATEAAPPTIVEQAPAGDTAPAPGAAGDAPHPATETGTPSPALSAAPPSTLHVATYAQLLSTSDQKVAEALAARLIDRGFTTSYVERGTTGKGLVFRVRVKFDSEAEARAAEPRLREFSKEVWITTK